MFENDLSIVLGFEGGYANNPNDPGGATNFGVTQKTYDAFRVTNHLDKQSVEKISQNEVNAIYKGYYNGARCNELEISHPKTSLCHFDCAINQGIAAACYILQRAINAVWHEAKVTTDGVIGPKTLEALKPLRDADVLLEYLNLRKARYDQLIAARPNMGEFKSSWYDRLNKIASRSTLMVPWKAA